MKVSRQWLQKYFATSLPDAPTLAELLTHHAFEIEGVSSVEGDSIIDIDVLSNRSSDCLSHRGIAREIATLLATTMDNDPFRKNLETYEVPSNLTVTVEDTALCDRYMAGVMRGVRVGPSPKWLVQALTRMGQKSINNVVDATNYVMFDLGQPIHAFDMSKLSADENGARGITVRLASEGEHIVTLTGDEYTLKNTHQVITDSVSGEPIALAGIKGGKTAEVTEETVDIVIEVAHFHPTIVRKTAQDLKLQTDASLRFQNEPSARLCAFALRDVLELLSDIAEGSIVGVCDTYKEEVEHEPITVSLADISATLGVSMKVADVEAILVRLEWEFSRHGDIFVVTPPWERSDVTIREAVIEEVGRIYGYRNIVSALPPLPKEKPALNPTQYYIEKIQRIMTECGFSEVLTYTLVEKGEVELLNPFASDKACMRASLREGMTKALALNAQHAPLLGLSAVKLFEVGTVFKKDGERLSFCAGVQGVTVSQKNAEKELNEKLSSLIATLGYPIEYSIKDGVCEFDLEALLPRLQKPDGYEAHFTINPDSRFTQWSPYPFVLRDIAVWVPDSVRSDDVASIVRQHATDLLVRIDLFDTFEKDGKISYAWHLVFQSYEKTLTDTEVNMIMEKVTHILNEKEGWSVR